MTRQADGSAFLSAQPAGRAAKPVDFPMREYIGAMARELARLARGDRDEVLAALLEAAAERTDESCRRFTQPSLNGRGHGVALNGSQPAGHEPPGP